MERTLSMSAALAASTVTPGMTAPDVSLTTPAIEAPSEVCAHAATGTSNTIKHSATDQIAWDALIVLSFTVETILVHPTKIILTSHVFQLLCWRMIGAVAKGTQIFFTVRRE